MEKMPESEINPAESFEKRIERAKTVFSDFIGLQPGERVLFLIDDKPNNTDPELIKALQEYLKRNGFEFSEIKADERLTMMGLVKKIKDISVIWNSWDMEETEIDFDELTEHLEKTGKRMVFSPGIKIESLNEDGALSEKREDIEYRLEKMDNRLRDVAGMTVKTTYGTNLEIKFRPGERRWFKDNSFIHPGGWDNLPGGEIFTTPDEQSVNGVLVLPILQDEVTLDQGVDKYVYLTIRNGKIAKIDGGRSADILRKYLEEKSIQEKIDPTSVIQCAEVSFGANSKARQAVSNPESDYTAIANPTTETEKRLGTMHLAFGSSKHGEEGTEGYTCTESGVHLDFVIPRNGLTVTAYDRPENFEKKKNGERLIDEGRWNFLD